MAFDTAVISGPGSRSENVDCADCLVSGETGCWVLADGLGGATASRLAVNAVLASFRACPDISSEAMQRHLHAAHQAICQEQSRPGLKQLKSTIAVLLADSSHAICGNIGDSRIYLFRAGDIEYQSPDHSVPGALMAGGVLRPSQVRVHEDRYRLLRSLGSKNEAAAALRQFQLCSKDAFLLCTDGFWEYVTELEMTVDLSMSKKSGDWLQLMEARLLRAVPRDSDSFSAVAVFFNSPQAPSLLKTRIARASLPDDTSVPIANRVSKVLVWTLAILLLSLIGASAWIRLGAPGSLKSFSDAGRHVSTAESK
jgi:serine/threonine protein phosphatase PrpC